MSHDQDGIFLADFRELCRKGFDKFSDIIALVFLLARAFSSGCAALTGVEAISNGVPAFRKPKSKNAATTLLHGADEAMKARAASEAAFEQGRLSADLPTVELPRDEVIGAMIAAVTTKAGLTASNGEARRLAQGGGLRLNDTAVADGAQLIAEADLNADGVLKLAAGKKKIVLVKPT